MAPKPRDIAPCGHHRAAQCDKYPSECRQSKRIAELEAENKRLWVIAERTCIEDSHVRLRSAAERAREALADAVGDAPKDAALIGAAIDALDEVLGAKP